MWEQIGSILLNYWIEFLFGGLLVAIGGFFIRRYIKLSTNERNQRLDKLKEDIEKENNKRFDEIEKQSKKEDEKIMKQVDALRAGVLSIQGREFKKECERLLEDGHVITIDEWEEIDADHEAYNGLKGNHRGDHLYELVKKKAENNLTKN